MQRDNTAHRHGAPIQNTHPSPPPTATADKPAKFDFPIRELAIKHRKTAIVIAAAIVLIALFWFAPTLATGLVFAGALFGINTLIDSRMAGGEK